MDWKTILGAVAAGAILGIGGTFLALSTRVAKLESSIEFMDRRLGALEKETAEGAVEMQDPKSDKAEAEIYLIDELDDNKSGWDVESLEGKVARTFANGKYVVANLEDPKTSSWHVSKMASRLPDQDSDIELTVRAKPGDSAVVNQIWGLLVLEDDKNYLAFTLGQNGEAGVYHFHNGEWGNKSKPLERLAGAVAINDRLYNKFKVERRNDVFTYYINSKVVGRGSVNTIKWTRLGVGLGPGITADVDVLKIVLR